MYSLLVFLLIGQRHIYIAVWMGSLGRRGIVSVSHVVLHTSATTIATPTTWHLAQVADAITRVVASFSRDVPGIVKGPLS